MVAQEPDWDEVVNAILDIGDSDIDSAPTGIEEYYFTGHSKDMAIIEGFHYSLEWIKSKPVLFEYLKERFTNWWEDQAHDDFDHLFMTWLEGGDIRNIIDGHLDDMVLKLTNIYRKRIVETHKCSVCGKEISEKHPYRHPDSIVRLGHPVDYPDGWIPKDTPRDEIKWKNKLYCHPCYDARHPIRPIIKGH